MHTNRCLRSPHDVGRSWGTAREVEGRRGRRNTVDIGLTVDVHGDWLIRLSRTDLINVEEDVSIRDRSTGLDVDGWERNSNNLLIAVMHDLIVG